MAFWDDDHEHAKAHKQVNEAEHKAHLSHELIASAAAYEAAKAYQDHVKKEGKPTSHEKAKEVLAGLTAFAVTRLVETKGLDAIDKAKAKRDAQKYAEEGLSSGKHY